MGLNQRLYDPLPLPEFCARSVLILLSHSDDLSFVIFHQSLYVLDLSAFAAPALFQFLPCLVDKQDVRSFSIFKKHLLPNTDKSSILCVLLSFGVSINILPHSGHIGYPFQTTSINISFFRMVYFFTE